MEVEKRKFLVKVNQQSGRKVGDLSECWLWEGNKDASGYGRIQTNAAKKAGSGYAHQLAYNLFKDPTYVASREKPVRHLCENSEIGSHRCCVNPDHLTLGTILENMADRQTNLGNYQLKGEHVGTAKFTLEQAKAIQAAHLSGKMYKDLAEEFKVNRRTIERICVGEHYGLPDCRPALKKQKEGRDAKILEMLAAGNSPKQIKETLGVSAAHISVVRNAPK